MGVASGGKRVSELERAGRRYDPNPAVGLPVPRLEPLDIRSGEQREQVDVFVAQEPSRSRSVVGRSDRRVVVET